MIMIIIIVIMMLIVGEFELSIVGFKERGKMIKTDLIDRVAFRTRLTRKQTAIVVNTFLSSITESLIAGNDVDIRGFGSFRIRHRNARMGLNPKNMEKVYVPSKKVPYFRPGKSLKLKVNKKFDTELNNKIFTLQDLTQIA